jgi:hypothetical protein
MDDYTTLVQAIALTLGVAWASGINLYAAVAMLGLGGALGYIDLPPTLDVVQDPLVIGAAVLMYCVEFTADKVPGVDSGWDALHTFIRIPAGAALAAGAVGDVTPALAIAAGLVGGGVTAVTHATKAGSRALINTSPEPFSNWVASLAEDAAVFIGLWAALQHPVLFLSALALFLLFLCWFLPRLWRGVHHLIRKIGSVLPFQRDPSGQRERQLRELADAGVSTETEYRTARDRLGPA